MKAVRLLAAVFLVAVGSGLRAEEPFYLQPKSIDVFLSVHAPDPFALATTPMGELSEALTPRAAQDAVGLFTDQSWARVVAPPVTSVALLAEPQQSPLAQAVAPVNFDWQKQWYQPIDRSLTTADSPQRSPLMGGLAH